MVRVLKKFKFLPLLKLIRFYNFKFLTKLHINFFPFYFLFVGSNFSQNLKDLSEIELIKETKNKSFKKKYSNNESSENGLPKYKKLKTKIAENKSTITENKIAENKSTPIEPKIADTPAVLGQAPIETKIAENKSIPTETKIADNSFVKNNNYIPNYDWLLGKIKYEKNENFVKVSNIHTYKENVYLEKNTYYSYIKMYNAAKKEGITLNIVSGVRSFNDQKNIWERKWENYKKQKKFNSYKKNNLIVKNILKFSAMPSTSRHHWGTDLDIHAVEDRYFKKGEGKKIWKWLRKNASLYGFCQVYTEKGNTRKTGYSEEKWHWSYIPISKNLLKDYIKFVNYEKIADFTGSHLASEIKIISHYVNGLDESCK